jgi:hypothetical protein
LHVNLDLDLLEANLFPSVQTYIMKSCEGLKSDASFSYLAAISKSFLEVLNQMILYFLNGTTSHEISMVSWPFDGIEGTMNPPFNWNAPDTLEGIRFATNEILNRLQTRPDFSGLDDLM